MIRLAGDDMVFRAVHAQSGAHHVEQWCHAYVEQAF
jgi:hypothetical protein